MPRGEEFIKFWGQFGASLDLGPTVMAVILGEETLDIRAPLERPVQFFNGSDHVPGRGPRGKQVGQHHQAQAQGLVIGVENKGY